MNWLEWLTVVFQALTVVVLVFTVVELRAAAWWRAQADLWHTDPDAARFRKQHPPRSVRAHQAVDRLTAAAKARL